MDAKNELKELSVPTKWKRKNNLTNIDSLICLIREYPGIGALTEDSFNLMQAKGLDKKLRYKW